MRVSKRTYTKRRKKQKTKRKRIRGGTFETPEKQKPEPHDQNAPEKLLGQRPPVLKRSLFGVRKQIGQKGDEIRHTYDGNPGIEADPDAYTEGYKDAINFRVSRFHYSEMTQPGNIIKDKKYIEEYERGRQDGLLKLEADTKDEV